MSLPLASTPLTRSTSDLFSPIADDLEAVEKILRDDLETSQPGVAALIEHLSHYRGKRLRPALLLLTARACGLVVPAHHLLGAVVEMIHTATLVHDDVLDDATLRRHVPTINARWGNQASILLGDYLFTHAFHLTSTLDDARACRIIGESTNRLCAGELHQIVERGNLDLSEDDYLDIIDGKTAELTSCCCRLGAMYAGCDEEVVERLARFGRLLGLAFQIADDLLDITGQERQAGKSLGTDLEQQKLTLPLIRLLQTSSPEHSARLKQILGAPGNHKRDRLQRDLEATGAIVFARQRAEQYAVQAAQLLSCLDASPCRSILERLTQRVVHREC